MGSQPATTGDEGVTVADGVAARAVKRAAPLASSQHATVTPEQAMRLAEISRLRLFAGFLAGLCTVGGVVVTTLGGDPLARRIHVAAIAVTGLVAAGCAALLSDPARYRSWVITALVAFASLTNITGYYYWGVISGYIAVVTVSAYVVTATGERSSIVAGSAISIGGHLAVGTCELAGWLPERALLPMGDLATFDQVSTMILLNVMVVGAIVLGAQHRKAMQASIDEQLAAVRELARREAQLAEVHAEMRDAMELAGRYSGQTIGRYAVGKLLGRGAMGEVYAAEDATDHTPCAIKMLAPHLAADRVARQRFERELRAVEAVRSPHIVRIVEVSPAEATLPYLVMERLEGEDLAEAIKQQPVHSLHDVAELVRQVAAGLDAAHAVGIVHRDLTPRNIFGCAGAGTRTWKVLDFGIAKPFADGQTITVGNIVGTPGYMAPEQASGGAVDPRTDIYALGVLAYRLLTGVPAVVPGEIPAMLHEVVYRMPARPSSMARLSPEVEAVLAIALAKRATDRFTSAGAFATALAEAAAGRRDSALAERAAAILAVTPWGHWSRYGRSHRSTVQP